MKILFVSSQPINRNYSTGNTIINFFKNFSDTYSFYNIALRKGEFEPGFFNSAISFDDMEIIKSVFKRKEILGVYHNFDERMKVGCEEDSISTKLYRYKTSPIMRYIGLFIRNCFWGGGTWKKTVELYIEEVNPDIIFFATSGMTYSHNIVHYIHKVSGAPIVLFHADDHYTLKCVSINPLFWLNRLSSRNNIKRSVKLSAYNFCITQLQCDEYSKAMQKTCKLLTKGRAFIEPKIFKQDDLKTPLEFIYTGNIFYGRWRTLAYVGGLLDEVNKEGYYAVLKIYTGNELSKKIEKTFNAIQSIEMMGEVPNSEIETIQENADILVHAESFQLREKLLVRQSFSTKIVDYIHSGRCVLAAGANDIAPIQYFSKNDIGLVLTGNKEKDVLILKKAFEAKIREKYAQKAWEYGKANHDTAAVEKKLLEAFTSVTK